MNNFLYKILLIFAIAALVLYVGLRFQINNKISGKYEIKTIKQHTDSTHIIGFDEYGAYGLLLHLEPEFNFKISGQLQITSHIDKKLNKKYHWSANTGELRITRLKDKTGSPIIFDYNLDSLNNIVIEQYNVILVKK